MQPAPRGRWTRGSEPRSGRATLTLVLATLSLTAGPPGAAEGKPKRAVAVPAKVGAAAAHEKPKPALVLPEVSVSAADIQRHAQALSAIAQDPALSPGDRGSRTRQYIAEQLYESGLAPGGDGEHGAAGLLQAVPLQGQSSVLQGRPRFVGTSTTIPVQVAVAARELVLWSGLPQPEVSVKDSELVFVGYGITAAERAWDDYKGIDVRGKTVLMLDGLPRELAAAGVAYRGAGRYAQKFSEALRRGAIAAVLIHSPSQSEHSLDTLRAYFGSERLLAPLARDGVALQAAGYLHDEAARRVLLAGGLDLEAQQQAAETREFTPQSLRVRMSAQLKNQTRSVDSANVVGILSGADEAARGEAVVISTHHDHLSAIADGSGGQQLLPGVRDRLVGVAGLLAMAQATRKQAPARRSLIFAVLGGHSESFVGAQRLLKRLPAPAQRVVAQINIDGLNVGPASTELVQIGRGKSTLDELLDSVAKATGRTVIADRKPERGLLYRSESLVFARAGAPVLFLAPPDLEQYLTTDYLRPSDTLRESFSFTGAAQDCALLYQLGWLTADSPTLPYFVPGDEFAPRAPAAPSAAP